MSSNNKYYFQKNSDLETLESFKNLISNVKSLKDKTWGCPWQKLQSHISLIPFLHEESSEFTDAIYEKNTDNICEELGDLLLQIMLHAEIGYEEKEFELNDVIKNLNKKIINRHPYIFKKKEKVSLEKSQQLWEDIKNYGFKWESTNQIFEKLEEEINELKEAIKSKKESNIKDEFGDVFFTLINLSNFLKINPDSALQNTNKKFLERFSIIEHHAGDNIKKQTPKDFQRLWQVAKKKLMKNNS